MVGLLLTLLFAIGAEGVGELLLSRLTKELDPALRIGACGLVGLASLGTLTLPIGLLPGGTHWGVYVIGAVALVGWGLGIRSWRAQPIGVSPPSGVFLLVILGCALAAFCSLVGVLSPSDANDWDTLAYHLAAPKIWLLDGQIHFISFIHHSNFPLSIDGLYIWGLTWGGQAGAKAFSFAFGVYGALSMFGFARGRYGSRAGWIALLSYVAIPMVVWESGTGYIDVGNGLFVALGILFAAALAVDPAAKQNMWLSGIFLGFAAGSKYTGLQTIVAVGFVLVVLRFLATRRLALKEPVLIGAVALAIASPWYVKNVVNTGNPVYPFFYSVFKGKNWDAFSDKIYRNQQQYFGAARVPEGNQAYTDAPLQPTRVGAAVLGLAYQPGRYADPAPASGQGLPFVSLGAVAIAALLFWLFSGRMETFEIASVGAVGFSLAMWFVLSEQSRYILGLAFVLTVLAGGAATKLKAGTVLAFAAAVQLLASIFFFTRYGDPDPTFGQKLKVVLGSESAEDYERRAISFYEPAQDLDKMVGTGRVALYDEVFGFLLDVPYFWANPGHTTEMGYEEMQSVEELIASYKRLGITHVYINLPETFGRDPQKIDQWLGAAGFGGPGYSPAERASLMKDPQGKYKVLLAEAAASGKVTLMNRYGKAGSRIIFEVP